VRVQALDPQRIALPGQPYGPARIGACRLALSGFTNGRVCEPELLGEFGIGLSPGRPSGRGSL
jgi:hypothetical protein